MTLDKQREVALSHVAGGEAEWAEKQFAAFVGMNSGSAELIARGMMRRDEAHPPIVRICGARKDWNALSNVTHKQFFEIPKRFEKK